ncbi:MAG: hypothetical protein ABSG90_12785 [Dehalococcoidia bacterium]|jgi:hypothetical protein
MYRPDAVRPKFPFRYVLIILVCLISLGLLWYDQNEFDKAMLMPMKRTAYSKTSYSSGWYVTATGGGGGGGGGYTVTGGGGASYHSRGYNENNCYVTFVGKMATTVCN